VDQPVIVCRVCGQGQLYRSKVNKSSAPVVAIGWILLIPSLLTILGTILLAIVWALALAGNAANSTDPNAPTATAIVASGSMMFFGCVGLSAFVGGLLGWLLVQQKNVLVCSTCKSTTDTA
jgi:hypothetical protein